MSEAISRLRQYETALRRAAESPSDAWIGNFGGASVERWGQARANEIARLASLHGENIAAFDRGPVLRFRGNTVGDIMSADTVVITGLSGEGELTDAFRAALISALHIGKDAGPGVAAIPWMTTAAAGEEVADEFAFFHGMLPETFYGMSDEAQTVVAPLGYSGSDRHVRHAGKFTSQGPTVGAMVTDPESGDFWRMSARVGLVPVRQLTEWSEDPKAWEKLRAELAFSRALRDTERSVRAGATVEDARALRELGLETGFDPGPVLVGVEPGTRNTAVLLRRPATEAGSTIAVEPDQGRLRATHSTMLRAGQGIVAFSTPAPSDEFVESVRERLGGAFPDHVVTVKGGRSRPAGGPVRAPHARRVAGGGPTPDQPGHPGSARKL